MSMMHNAHDTLYFGKENKQKSLSPTAGILGKNPQNIRGFIHAESGKFEAPIRHIMFSQLYVDMNYYCLMLA